MPLIGIIIALLTSVLRLGGTKAFDKLWQAGGRRQVPKAAGLNLPFTQFLAYMVLTAVLSAVITRAVFKLLMKFGNKSIQEFIEQNF